METPHLSEQNLRQEIMQELLLLPEAYLSHVLLIISTLRKELEEIKQLDVSPSEAGQNPTSILRLQGLGSEVWANVDVNEYIAKERDAWD